MLRVSLVKQYFYSLLFSTAFVHLTNVPLMAQTGSVTEPVRYIGGNTIDPSVHEGRLRYAIGTENIQVLRANREHPELADGFGWTYNHAPNLAYWEHTFFLQYLSNPKDEHVAPGHTMLVTSENGRQWEKPKVVFPAYEAPEGVAIPEGYNGYMMHQRMGFYVAPNDRLLVLGFYGHTDHPFGKGGIGRVVREVKKDGSFGQIYFLRYSSFTNFNENNTSYPFFKKSKDEGFVEACEALLADRLITLQWLDEDYGMDDFYGEGRVPDSVEAFSYYHRPDGKVVGLWKFSHTALSSDEGQTFSAPVKTKTLLMAGGKVWGQRTDDDRYALVYNPIEMQEYRFPLAIVTGNDGAVFDNLLLVQGEVPQRRFFGRWKDFGSCYTRGIVEGNGNPPGDDMWLTYSMNKEDIWVSRVPLSVKYMVEGDVADNFEDMKVDGQIKDWNSYAPQWASAKIVAEAKSNKALELTDADPYDYARAIRVFEEGKNVKLSFKVKPQQDDKGTLQVEVTDQFGNRPVRVYFLPDGRLVAYDGSKEIELGKYKKETWYKLELEIDAYLYGSYSLILDGKVVLENAALHEAVKSVERISFRTGDYRSFPTRKTPNQKVSEPLEGADDKVEEAIFLVDDVEVRAN
ncbi:hypothetical protein R9C00_28945 [Flammeovirgaceae bacterium SG7u.111]|nr:hypothetical protein [Flammeovirgaceae bacterium SG7u.132]WPO35727.1 hypothetical protein R9C00_28945 [Flammeovirgaceae bacterium SG7u.111]